MSNEYINSAVTIARQTGLQPREKLLLVLLANRANAGGRCWPSVERLRAEACYSNVDTVSAGLKRLEQLDIIAIEHNKGATTNVYQLLIPRIEFDPENKHKNKVVERTELGWVISEQESTHQMGAEHPSGGVWITKEPPISRGLPPISQVESTHLVGCEPLEPLEPPRRQVSKIEECGKCVDGWIEISEDGKAVAARCPECRPCGRRATAAPLRSGAF